MKEMNENLKKKTNILFYGLMKEARRQSFIDFLEYWEISYDEYEEIKEYFKKEGFEL